MLRCHERRQKTLASARAESKCIQDKVRYLEMCLLAYLAFLFIPKMFRRNLLAITKHGFY